MTGGTATPDRSHAPATRDFESLTLPPITDYPPQGSVQLHVLRGQPSPLCRVDVLWGEGTLNNPDPVKRCASVLGTKLLPEGCAAHTGDGIADIIDFEGAWVTPLAPLRYCVLSLVCLPASLRRMLQLLADVFRAPTVPAEAFAAKQAAMADDRRQAMARIAGKAADRLRRLTAGSDHPYLLRPTEEQIMSVTRQDVIEALERDIRHSRLHIYAAGTDSPEAMEALHAFAADMRSLSGVEYGPYPIVAPRPEAEHTAEIIVPGSVQTALGCAIPVPITRFHPDYHYLRQTIIALGGYFGSRLMTNIREEKGLTYGISASLQSSQGHSEMLMSAQCSGGKGRLALDECVREIRRLAAEPFPDDELLRLRRHLATSMAAVLDTPFSILDHHILTAQLDIPDNYFSRQFECVRTLDSDKIREMAGRYLDPDKMYTVSAGAPME